MLTAFKPKEPVKEFQFEIKLLEYTQVFYEVGESPIITLKWSLPFWNFIVCLKKLKLKRLHLLLSALLVQATKTFAIIALELAGTVEKAPVFN